MSGRELATQGILVVVFLLILLWGAFLRLEGLGRQSLWIDEAVFVAQAQGVYRCGVPQMPDGNINRNSQSAVYLASLGFYCSNDFHVGARIPSALAGILCIALAFGAVRTMTGHASGGLLAAAMIAFSSVQIAWSRQAEPYIFMELFLLVTIAALAKHFSTGRAFWLWIGFIASGLCVGTHAGGYVAGLLFSLYLFAWLFQQAGLRLMKRCDTSNWRGYLPVAILAMVLIVMSILARVPIGHSGLRETLEMLRNPFNTNYALPYALLLFKDTGFVGMGLIAVCCWYSLRSGRYMPILVFGVGALYYVLISFSIWTYAERYLLPLQTMINVLVASGFNDAIMAIGLALTQSKGENSQQIVSPISTPVSRKIGLSPGLRGSVSPTQLISYAMGLILAGFVVLAGNKCVLPGKDYWLGVTAPQPDWRSAYDVIRAEAARRCEDPVTISPYPLLHDLYVGREKGGKFYVPISFGGHPGGVSWSCGHTIAPALETVADLKNKAGYVLMDEMAMRMIGKGEVRDYLASLKPLVVIPGPYKVFVWRKGDTSLEDGKKEVVKIGR